MKEALYYIKRDGDTVQCELCPHNCIIKEGKSGICNARQNNGGILYSLIYKKPCAVHVDPIEKKPLYHFLPGSRSFSIGTVGCNLRCMHCQNWELSTSSPGDVFCNTLSSDDCVKLATQYECQSISYTYNEPSINFEYVLETAQKAHASGIKNVMVTNGFINEKPLRQLYQYIDAANVDLKAFDDEFYKKICKARLEPVLKTLTILKEMNVWIEVTNLVIPTHNDSTELIQKLVEWFVKNLGNDVPLHFTAFYPAHKMTNVPPTPLRVLKNAYDIAYKAGIHYIYLGNVRESSVTRCPSCGRDLIVRSGFNVMRTNLHDGKCICGATIPGVWR